MIVLKDTGIMKFKKNVKYKKRRICENKPWYNEECEVKRKLYFAARNNYSVDKSERSRHIMVNLNKDYKKCLKRAYRVYKVEFNRNLRSIRNTNTKEYWNILNDKKKHEDIPVSKEELYNHFKQLSECNIDLRAERDRCYTYNLVRRTYKNHYIKGF